MGLQLVEPPVEVQRKIFHDNARRVLDLDS
jgi:predicted TIM-barrel fold metal-dependent hydrolase